MSQPSTWTRVAKSNALQRSSVCVSAIDSTIYVFGGELKPRQPRDNDIHKFSLTKDASENEVQTISAKQNAPSPRVGAASTTLNGKIYMFSGRGGEAMAPIDEKGSMWVLNPSTGGWSASAPSSSNYPEPRSYHCMAGDGQDTIYLHAGCPEKGRLSDLWAFSVAKAEWNQLASAPDPPRGGASIAFVHGALYRMNGFDGNTEQGGSVDTFDIATNRWSSTTYPADGNSGPGARSVSVLMPVRTQNGVSLVTIFGESDPSSLGHQGAGKMLNDVWAYSLAEKKWARIETTVEDCPEGRGWFDADVVKIGGKDRIVIAGGLGESNNRLDDAWMLTLS